MEAQHVRVELEREGFRVVYEGVDKFYERNIAPLIDAAMSSQGPVSPDSRTSDGDNESLRIDRVSINQIVADMKPKTAADMVMCAAAKLQLVDGVPSFSWSDLLPVIKSANDYRRSHTATRTNTLNSLIRSKRLNERANNTYTIPSEEQRKIAAQIGIEPTTD